MSTDPNVQNLESDLSGDANGNQNELPAKFKGKSTAEIIQMYQSQESELGRKNNEVGHLRRLTDTVLGLHQANTREPANQPKPEPIKTEDLLANPDKVVTERAREIAEERGAQSDARMAQLESNLALQTFERKFPKYEQDLQDPTFHAWVTKSNLRQQLAVRAARGDYNAAEELFTIYNDSKPADSSKENNEEDPNLKAADRGSLVRGGGAAVSNTSGTENGKKVYSRTELIDLRIKDPEQFHRRFESEFLPAYKDKRVR